MRDSGQMHAYESYLELPFYFRVVSICRLPGASRGTIQNIAELYHDEARIRVCWESRTVDVHVQRGAVVALRGIREFSGGEVMISGLDVLDSPKLPINPFRLIPPEWVGDRMMISRMAALWEQIDWTCRLWMQEILQVNRRGGTFQNRSGGQAEGLAPQASLQAMLEALLWFKALQLMFQ